MPKRKRQRFEDIPAMVNPVYTPRASRRISRVIDSGAGPADYASVLNFIRSFGLLLDTDRAWFADHTGRLSYIQRVVRGFLGRRRAAHRAAWRAMRLGLGFPREIAQKVQDYWRTSRRYERLTGVVYLEDPYDNP